MLCWIWHLWEASRPVTTYGVSASSTEHRFCVITPGLLSVDQLRANFRRLADLRPVLTPTWPYRLSDQQSAETIAASRAPLLWLPAFTFPLT